MYFDSSKRVQGAGAGVVLISPHGDKLKYVLRMSFPQASNNEAEYKALLHGMKMAVDKFTKWVEVAPVTTQDSTAAINFIKSIVFHFGVPYSIITDNRTNFTSKEFKSYCEGLGIKLKFTSVAHPKTNRQVKKSQWPNMQWDKKEALSTSRESQECLGR
jgi:ribonuclease HI